MSYKLIYENKEDRDKLILNTPLIELIELKNFGEQSRIDGWKNILAYGENLGIMKTLLEKNNLKGKVKLIYIDPPFSTNKEWMDLDKNHAYHDNLTGSEFIEFIRKRLVFLKELLSDDGSIYVHIDQKKGHYIKIIMDEIFGEENFINDITRIKCNPKSFDRKAFGNFKDVIYFYSKNPGKNLWTDYKKPLTKNEIEKQFPRKTKEGRRYATTPLHAPGETQNGVTGQEWKDMKPPKGRHWRYPPEKLTKLDEEGLIEWSKTGNPRKMIFADESPGKKMQDVWEFKDLGVQRQVYPTEKNQEMMNFIINCSSKEEDIVLDCFCGSGSTLLSAEKFNRRWIGIDESKMAIEKSIKKINSLKEKKVFSVLNATGKDIPISDFQ